MQKRRRGKAEVSGTVVDQRLPKFQVIVLNPTAFDGEGSVIVLELADEDVAVRAAQMIARETGLSITVRDADAGSIVAIPAARAH
jgi:hypothetical protein